MRKGSTSRRQFAKTSLALAGGAQTTLGAASKQTISIMPQSPAPGPFQPFWESLKLYRCPEWFKDAKLGVSTFWSPQVAAEAGDWYARHMYMQGTEQYNYHLAHYGHPSKFGYKDLVRLWKGEKWEPEKLAALYKKAGARFLMVLANHHDNFDLWDSKHQAWNSVNIGPKKDIVAGWKRAAAANDLRFGLLVSNTPGRTWNNFMLPKYGSDSEGPLKGVPYDGHLTNSDAKGQWWEGFDLRAFYGPPHRQYDPCPEFTHSFMLRVQDVIEKYDLDLLTFDDSLEFFDDIAPSLHLDEWLGIGDLLPHIAAYYYNTNLQKRAGKLEAVLTIKFVPEPVRAALVDELEMFVNNKIMPNPWLTEVGIGGWSYKRGEHKYRSVPTMLAILIDIVSKNGALRLNAPLRADGTMDEEAVRFFEELAKWMAVNGEAIFDTRPWKVFGEGPTQFGSSWGDALGKTDARSFSGEDIRFTTKGDALYAIGLRWPDGGRLTIKSLAANSPHWKGEIAAMQLLGSGAPLQWTRDAGGLRVTLPGGQPQENAYALKIRPFHA